MVPESVNLSDLSEQFLVDGVALERDNDALHQDLMAEKAQQSLVVQPDYGAGVRGFADSLAHPLPVGLLSALLLVVVAAAVGASLMRIKAYT